VKSKQISIIFIAGILLNLTGHLLNISLSLPLFLDSIGTVLAAATLGPWIGAIVGFLSNLILGLLTNPIMIPFALVNVIIGIVVGLFARKRGFKDFLTPLYASVALAIICPLVASPIAVYLFGGVTGGGLDKIFYTLLQSGQDVMSSAFLTRVPVTLADKLISTYLIVALIHLLPSNWRGLAEKGPGND
jgi:energy-coupling factor transport system substrate-specific component